MEFHKDLAARQEARDLTRQAEKAQHLLADFPQEKLDAIVEAIASAFSAQAAALAKLAVEETGFGNVPDKTTKNRFASETVAKAVRGMKTVFTVHNLEYQGRFGADTVSDLFGLHEGWWEDGTLRMDGDVNLM